MPELASPASREEFITAHFASMVMQNTQMAMMLLGQMPHPATGQTVVDLEGARMFIDQLEMLEVKTKGNLNKDEIHLLKEGLMATRMAFVAATQNSSTTGTSSAADGPPPSNAPTMLSPTATPDNAESAKRYSKKY